LCQIRLIDGLSQGFFKLRRQLKVFMFEGKADLEEVVESKLFSKIVAELSSFELLEEEHEYFCKAFRVFV
jgi:hypothetical protein